MICIIINTSNHHLIYTDYGSSVIDPESPGLHYLHFLRHVTVHQPCTCRQSAGRLKDVQEFMNKSMAN